MSGNVDLFNISLNNFRMCSVKMKTVPYSKLQNPSHKSNLCYVCSQEITGTLSTYKFVSKTMSVNTVPSINYYSLDVIQDEARRLVQKGMVSRQQPIYSLCQYIPAREWVCVECELEKCDFLLRDRIGDLIGREEWDND